MSFSISRLRPGDTLLLRGGVYYETPTIGVSGTAGKPITIAEYPGEQAIIASGKADTEIAKNSAWELFNPSIAEYRTVTSYGGSDPFAYIVLDTYPNEQMALGPYVDATEFRATTDGYVNSSQPFYVGPGIWKASDGRIHIRLSKTQDMLDGEARYGQVDTSIYRVSRGGRGRTVAGRIKEIVGCRRRLLATIRASNDQEAASGSGQAIAAKPDSR